MGRLGVAPNQIDEHGLLRVAFRDARDYERDATRAVEILKQYEVRVWFVRYEAHIKRYSLRSESAAAQHLAKDYLLRYVMGAHKRPTSQFS